MGLSISWVATYAPPATVLEALDLRDTGERGRAGGDEIVGVLLPNGAYVVCINHAWHPILEPFSLGPLSGHGRVVACALSDNTNTSLAFEFDRGQMVWQATHFLDKGDNDIARKGAVPESYARRVEEAKRAHEQEGHDAMFGVPVDLAAEVGGYRWEDMTEAPYTVLVPREIGEFEDSPSIWRRAVRRERATQLERTLGKPGKYLGKSLRVEFGKLGLKREFKSEDRVNFDREAELGVQRVSFQPSVGAVNVGIALECRQIEAILDGFGKTLARMRPWTFAFSLGFLEARPSIFYNYQSAEELEALANHLGARTPWWLQQMSTMQGLDRVLQQQRSAASRSSDVTRWLAELALAHLTGHSDVDALVRELAPDDDGRRTLLNRFVAYLRGGPSVAVE